MPGLNPIAVALAVSAAPLLSLSAQGKPVFLNPTGLSQPRGYTQVVSIPPGQGLLLLSGQVAFDSTGQLVGAGDFRAQATQVFRNIRTALAAAGGSFADVVKLTFYVRDVGELATLRAVRDEFIDVAHPPASTLVEVGNLFRPDVLLEVEAVATTGTRR